MATNAAAEITAKAVTYRGRGGFDVIAVAERPVRPPVAGEVRIKVDVSGLSPGDVKKRAGWQGSPMPFPRVIPHSDGAGVVESAGRDVDPGR